MGSHFFISSLPAFIGLYDGNWYTQPNPSTSTPAQPLENFATLKDLKLTNEHDVFVNHLGMFLINPDKLNDIFSKYDRDDLIRCLEKNHKVIEKL